MELEQLAEGVSEIDEATIVKLACVVHISKKCTESHTRKTEAQKLQQITWECVAAYVAWDISILQRVQIAAKALAKAQATHAYLESLPE